MAQEKAQEQQTVFEGQEITEFMVAIPAVKLEADESYQRGTYLDLQVQVRVRSARFEETKSGDLQKVHVMAVENVAIANITTPDQRRAAIEAQEAAAAAKAPEEEDVDLLDGSSTEPSIEADENDDWEAGYPQGQDEEEGALPQPATVGF